MVRLSKKLLGEAIWFGLGNLCRFQARKRGQRTSRCAMREVVGVERRLIEHYGSVVSMWSRDNLLIGESSRKKAPSFALHEVDSALSPVAVQNTAFH